MLDLTCSLAISSEIPLSVLIISLFFVSSSGAYGHWILASGFGLPLCRIVYGLFFA